MIGIGIDTGGTCTDAVIYDFKTKEVLATGKTFTTKQNLEIGIANVLDQLPQELLKKAGDVSLSTTLATNACVENKGCRAKLLIIGTDEEMIKRIQDVLLKYGIDDLSQIVILDARAENLFSNAFDPNWDELSERAPGIFADCDSVGIVQTFPEANGGRFEFTALRILKEKLTIPVTIAYDINRETDILKVCASTLLNARLIPLIQDFMKAVHHVMEQRGMDVPVYIVRSDGTLMSEEMALSCPVETLLSGPAASVIGSYELSKEKSAIAVDMGGTTTDFALVINREPKMAEEGIYIGNYRTTIKGIEAGSISLGGDTAVRYRDGKLFLDTERIIPISLLASQYEGVAAELQKLLDAGKPHTRCIHEFYVLQKEISADKKYTKDELKAVAVLKDGPLISRKFAAAMGTDIYHINTSRLEHEGIIIKSGLTTTDMMTLKGDFPGYDPKAASILCQIIELNTGVPAAQLPDTVYDLVLERMYKKLGGFILRHQYPADAEHFSDESMDLILGKCYEQAKECAAKNPDDKECGEKQFMTNVQNDKINITTETNILQMNLSTKLPLVGIGAPIHVFLGMVAKLLGTKAIIPEYATVANAFGAVAGRKVARFDLPVIAKYNGYSIIGYVVVAECRKYMLSDRKEAVEFGKETALKEIKRRAEFQGLGDNPVIKIVTEEKRIGNKPTGVLLEIQIHAWAESRDS